MSLILEALRKSEAERRRAQAPDLFAEPQLALPRPHPTWPRWTTPALAGVGLITLLVALRAMWPQATPVAGTQVPQPVAVSKPVPVSSAPGGPASPITIAAVAPPQPTPHSTAMPAPAPPRTETTGPATPAAVATTPAFEQPRLPPEPVADIAAAAQPAPVQRTPTPARAVVPTPAREPADTMRLSDLGSEERQQLPTLKLSMHMWNDTPAQRFVILDGQRLGEGDRIGNAVVEEITRDGAILDWNGRRLRISMR